MPDREVLEGRAAPGLALLAAGLAFAALGLVGDRDMSGLLAGLLWAWLGGWQWATRCTVLTTDALRPAGSLRRVPWSEVLDVRRSRMAMHYADVEVEVRGRGRPVVLRERRDGADLAAVRSWWQAATGAGVATDPAGSTGSAGPA